MDIVVPTGAGKQVDEIVATEVTYGKRKMGLNWSTNGAFIRLDSSPTSTKKGALTEVGNGFISVRSFKETNGEREYAQPVVLNVSETELIEDEKLRSVVEMALTEAAALRAAAPNAPEPTVTDISSVF